MACGGLISEESKERFCSKSCRELYEQRVRKERTSELINTFLFFYLLLVLVVFISYVSPS